MINRIKGCFGRLFITGLVFWGFSLCLTHNLYAGPWESAELYHLEGKELTLSLRGERRVIPAEVLSGQGINLELSGIVHTGPDTFLELQLIPSGTVVKLSENTSLVYNGMDETGKNEDLGLLYGRIRVVTGEEANSVVVRSGAVSVRVSEGDFGIDYLMEGGERNSSPRPLFNVHVLRGSAEVFPYGMGGGALSTGSVNETIAYEGEGLSLDISSFHTFVDRKTLDNDVLVYWNSHNFAGSPPLPMPDTSIKIMELPAETVVINAPPSSGTISWSNTPQPLMPVPPSVTSNRAKAVCLVIGTLLTASSVAAQVVTLPRFDLISDGDTIRNIQNVSYVTLGTGIITMLIGILHPSR